MEKIVPISDLQTKAKYYVHSARESHTPIVITQRGRAAAVLMDYESYWGLMATLDEMSYPDWQNKLQKAERDFKSNKGKTLENYISGRHRHAKK